MEHVSIRFRYLPPPNIFTSPENSFFALACLFCLFLFGCVLGVLWWSLGGLRFGRGCFWCFGIFSYGLEGFWLLLLLLCGSRWSRSGFSGDLFAVRCCGRHLGYFGALAGFVRTALIGFVSGIWEFVLSAQSYVETAIACSRKHNVRIHPEYQQCFEILTANSAVSNLRRYKGVSLTLCPACSTIGKTCTDKEAHSEAFTVSGFFCHQLFLFSTAIGLPGIKPLTKSSISRDRS